MKYEYCVVCVVFVVHGNLLMFDIFCWKKQSTVTFAHDSEFNAGGVCTAFPLLPLQRCRFSLFKFNLSIKVLKLSLSPHTRIRWMNKWFFAQHCISNKIRKWNANHRWKLSCQIDWITNFFVVIFFFSFRRRR